MPPPSDLLLYHAHLAAGARFGERRGQPVVTSYTDAAGTAVEAGGAQATVTTSFEDESAARGVRA